MIKLAVLCLILVCFLGCSVGRLTFGPPSERKWSDLETDFDLLELRIQKNSRILLGLEQQGQRRDCQLRLYLELRG